MEENGQYTVARLGSRMGSKPVTSGISHTNYIPFYATRVICGPPSFFLAWVVKKSD